MNAMLPIKDYKVVEEIKEYLWHRNERDYILFMVGINTGLRISDILPLKVKSVRGIHIDIIEQKTGKRKLILINYPLRKALDIFITSRKLFDEDYLFSGRSKKHKTGQKAQPIDTSTAYKMMESVAKRFKLEKIGTHSLRKTFGYHFYLRTKDIALLMDLFNHSEESITLRYLGIKQDTLDEALSTFFM